ncbi:hypothetical protein SEA_SCOOBYDOOBYDOO_98 [Mycobacterium phage ScoobyDoobyDoo]|nr:hypothetical protein SEA_SCOOBYDOOBYDOO_98 [Mycobacterium phage ScoobyDoobyDoo]
MVAKASYIKNRPDLPGPPYHQADSDVSVLRPPISPTEEAVADAQERVEKKAPDPRDSVGPAGDPDPDLVEGRGGMGGTDEPVQQRGGKSRGSQRAKAEGPTEGAGS